MSKLQNIGFFLVAIVPNIILLSTHKHPDKEIALILLFFQMFINIFTRLQKHELKLRTKTKYLDLLSREPLTSEQCNTLLAIAGSTLLSCEEVEEALIVIGRSQFHLKKHFRTDCKFYNQSSYLHCAINPGDSCDGCKDYELQMHSN